MSARKIKVKFLALMVVLLFCGHAFGFQLTINGVTRNFQYKISVTIQSSKVEGTGHDNFPMLFDSTDDTNLKNDLKQFPAGKVVRSDSYDIVFATGDSTEILKHEKEDYDGTSGVYVAWVNIGTLNSGGKTIYMYYGSSDVDNDDVTYITGTNKPLVWDTNFKMVQHLEESCASSGCREDSTSNNNNGTPYSGIIITDLHTSSGKINGADDFDGTDDYVNVGSGSSLDNIEVKTVSAWIELADNDDANAIVVKGSEPAQTGWFLFYDSDPTRRRLSFIQGWSGTMGEWHTANGTIDVDTMYHIAVTYNRSSTSNDPVLYIDGASMAVTERDSPSGTLGDDGALDCYIAKYEGGLVGWGIIDEVRISNKARGDDWIKTSFNSMNDPDTFYSLGEEQTFVELSYFKAKPLNSAVLLEWDTETELDNEGFNILRSEVEDKEYVKINPYFIPARGAAGFGAEYSFTDYDVENGVTYYYLLEDIDFHGKSTLHGPVSATPNDIMLIWPIEWEPLGSGASIFSWASSGDFSFKVDVSTTPSFPDSKTLSFPEDGWVSSLSLWLRPEEWKIILRKARESSGQLFWRIRAKNQDARVACSDWKKFAVDF